MSKKNNRFLFVNFAKNQLFGWKNKGDYEEKITFKEQLLLELVHLLLVVFAPQYLDNGVLDTKKKSTQVLGVPTTL